MWDAALGDVSFPARPASTLPHVHVNGQSEVHMVLSLLNYGLPRSMLWYSGENNLHAGIVGQGTQRDPLRG